MKLLSHICLGLGFASIALSIGIWFYIKKCGPIFEETADPAHAERFGIFVGLWAPSFFILSERVQSLFVKK